MISGASGVALDPQQASLKRFAPFRKRFYATKTQSGHPGAQPSGNPTPSHADIEMTKAIIEVAKPLGIEVHDHIIVGKDGHASLKGLRLI